MTARETTEPGVATQHNGDSDRRSPDVVPVRGGRGVGRAARRPAGVGATAGPAARRGAHPARGPRAARAGGADPAALPGSTVTRTLHAALEGVDDATAVRPGSRLHRLLPAGQRHRAAAPLAGDRRGRGGPAGRHRRPDRRGAGEGHHRPGARHRRCSAGWSTGPVFTAHPTEASRRSVLELLRKIADVVRRRWRTRSRPAADGPLSGRAPRSPSWSTCSGRPTSCGSCARSPRTRPGPPPTTCSRSPPRSSRTCSRSWTGRSATIGVTLPPTARPLRFGTWAGGDRDGNPNVTPDGHPRRAGPAARLRPPRADRRGRGPAHRDVAPRPGWSRSPTSCWPASTADAEALPDHVCRRGRGSTPRSRTGSSSRFVRVRLQRTRDRLARRHAARARPRLPRPRRAAGRPHPDPRLDARRRRPADRRRRDPATDPDRHRDGPGPGHPRRPRAQRQAPRRPGRPRTTGWASSTTPYAELDRPDRIALLSTRWPAGARCVGADRYDLGHAAAAVAGPARRDPARRSTPTARDVSRPTSSR